MTHSEGLHTVPERNLFSQSALLSRRRKALWLLVLVLLSVASLVFSCVTGSVALGMPELAGAFAGLVSGHADSLAATVLGLRLERAFAAFLTGSALALAGCLMQALLRNPLADPYVLGVSGGASVGALSMLFLSASLWAVGAVAFGGAVAVALILYGLSRRDFVSADGASRLLLTGVILAFGCSAVVTLLLTVAPDHDLRGMVFWLVGDLSGATFNVGFLLTVFIVFIWAWRVSPAVNLLALHSDMAGTLGVRVSWLRKGLFIGSALLTATAVTGAGNIGFVGLIVPHACRMMWGSDHRFLFPAALLTGGFFLVLADTLARTLLAPQQLPVGVVTSLIGVPVFLLQLYRGRRI